MNRFSILLERIADILQTSAISAHGCFCKSIC